MKMYGAAMQINDILAARKNVALDTLITAFRVASALLVGVVILLVTLLRPSLLWNFPSSIPTPLVFLAGAWALGFVTGWVSGRIVRHYDLTVYLTDSHERRKLSREQQKQLINGGVGFLLGVLGTVVGGLILWALTR
jgi:hypothetical protein